MMLSAPLPAGPFGVIYADPPWRFKVWSRETGLARAADRHYPTMLLEDIKALPVSSVAARDCALFLWVTVPQLAHGLELMTAWGFTYKSSFVWVKDKFATGWWQRNQHEILLVGTRGHPGVPRPGLRRSSVIQAAVRQHSRKPDAVHEMIESYFPRAAKLELFARTTRRGWTVWGNEVGKFDEPMSENEWLLRMQAGDL